MHLTHYYITALEKKRNGCGVNPKNFVQSPRRLKISNTNINVDPLIFCARGRSSQVRELLQFEGTRTSQGLDIAGRRRKGNREDVEVRIVQSVRLSPLCSALSANPTLSHCEKNDVRSTLLGQSTEGNSCKQTTGKEYVTTVFVVTRHRHKPSNFKL